MRSYLRPRSPCHGRAPDHAAIDELPGRSDRSPRSSGATLLEITIVIAMMLSLTIGIGGAVSSTHSAYAEVETTRNAEADLARLLTRIVHELRFARIDSLSPLFPDDSDTLTFTTVSGWDDGEWEEGVTSTFWLDEGDLVLDNLILASGVSDLSITRVGQVLSVEVAIQRTVSVNGRQQQIVRNLATNIRLQDLR